MSTVAGAGSSDDEQIHQLVIIGPDSFESGDAKAAFIRKCKNEQFRTGLITHIIDEPANFADLQAKLSATNGKLARNAQVMLVTHANLYKLDETTQQIIGYNESYRDQIDNFKHFSSVCTDKSLTKTKDLILEIQKCSTKPLCFATVSCFSGHIRFNAGELTTGSSVIKFSDDKYSSIMFAGDQELYALIEANSSNMRHHNVSATHATEETKESDVGNPMLQAELDMQRKLNDRRVEKDVFNKYLTSMAICPVPSSFEYHYQTKSGDRSVFHFDTKTVLRTVMDKAETLPEPTDLAKVYMTEFINSCAEHLSAERPLLVGGLRKTADEILIWFLEPGVRERAAEDLLRYTANERDGTMADFLLAQIREKHNATVQQQFLVHMEDLESDLQTSQTRPAHIEYDVLNIGTLIKRYSDEITDIDTTTTTGKTALILAAKAGDFGLLETCLHSGANVDHLASNGVTALWYAAEAANPIITGALILNGARAGTRKRYDEACAKESELRNQGKVDDNLKCTADWLEYGLQREDVVLPILAHIKKIHADVDEQTLQQIGTVVARNITKHGQIDGSEGVIFTWNVDFDRIQQDLERHGFSVPSDTLCPEALQTIDPRILGNVKEIPSQTEEKDDTPTPPRSPTPTMAEDGRESPRNATPAADAAPKSPRTPRRAEVGGSQQQAAPTTAAEATVAATPSSKVTGAASDALPRYLKPLAHKEQEAEENRKRVEKLKAQRTAEKAARAAREKGGIKK